MCYSKCVSGNIQVVNGNTVTLEGRAAAIVEWLAQQAETINAAQRLKIELNCAGNQIKPSLTMFEDHVVIRM